VCVGGGGGGRRAMGPFILCFHCIAQGVFASVCVCVCVCLCVRVCGRECYVGVNGCVLLFLVGLLAGHERERKRERESERERVRERASVCNVHFV